MCRRARELDVAHALAAHFRLRHFDAALFANDAPMLQALVLAAQALVILDGTENLGAEKTVTLGFDRAVVDALRLLRLAEGPRPNHFRRRETDSNRIEILDRSLLFEQF